MSNLNIYELQNEIDRGEVVSTLINLKERYRMTDKRLSSIADEVNDSPELSSLQSTLLNEQEMMVGLAVRIKCRDIYEISQKIDFLNLVYLKEKSADDFSEADGLTKSIWKDCQPFL